MAIRRRRMAMKTWQRPGAVILPIAATLILLIPSIEKVSASDQSGTFSPTGSMNVPRGGLAVLLQTGRVLVVGGTDGSTIPDSTELYNPSTGKWTFTGTTLASHVGDRKRTRLNSSHRCMS